MAWTIVTTMNAPVSNVFAMTGLSIAGVKKLCLEIDAVTVTTDGTDIKLTMYVATVEITTNTYQWEVAPVSSGNSTDPDELVATSSILLTQNNANWDVGNASTKSFGGRVYIHNPVSTALYKRTSSHVSATGPTTNVINSQGSGVLLNAGAIDGIKLSGTSNLTGGQVRLFALS